MALLQIMEEWQKQLQKIELDIEENIEQAQNADELDLFPNELGDLRYEIEQHQLKIKGQLRIARSKQNWEQAQQLDDQLRFIKKLLLEADRLGDSLLDAHIEKER
ncbi:hypothetical protein N8E87_09370 [Avibacterium paragallinarum]|uniref:iron-sulfur cluster co-chaperone HscB C-terminal domain-containing protein n=1 Tax=Avibacterium paragallinarum TaxID=728 RepID=UPI0021F6CD05|nr:iron-sulfur cluster co-chaperone HscB C-terminal domain-containing protein [Avibacterium paragallinarum]UXN36373.1 hypothetical protein N8E87_09370 [Avibacterium paragallinarum]